MKTLTMNLVGPTCWSAKDARQRVPTAVRGLNVRSVAWENSHPNRFSRSRSVRLGDPGVESSQFRHRGGPAGECSPEGKVSTVLKAESPWSPCGVALHGEDLYVLEHINANSEADEDWPPRVRKVSPDGKFRTLVTFAPGQGKPEQRQ